MEISRESHLGRYNFILYYKRDTENEVSAEQLPVF